MAEVFSRHLVIVRHGESEGDVRRAHRDNGIKYRSDKLPQDEEQTELGSEQSIAAGKWIAKYVLEAYGFRSFDVCATSPMIRTKQSAASLGLSRSWIEDSLLTERKRGKIQGLTRAGHESLYPGSYEQMNKYPFHWVPPGGESMLEVVDRTTRFTEQIKDNKSVLVETHRDWIWAVQIPLEGISLNEALAIDTDKIQNGQILHYTNVDPQDGTVAGQPFCWKRSVCPWDTEEQVVETSMHWISLASTLDEIPV